VSTFAPTDLFIDGTWRAGDERAAIRSPYDGHVVAEVSLASARCLDDALAAGARAELRMAALARDERRAILSRAARLLTEHADTFAQRIVAECGKPITLARAEVERAVHTFTFAHDVLATSRDHALSLDVTAAGRGRYGVARHFPRGLALAITPFNFPLNLVAHKVAPALAAGCPVIVKPADQAPLTALALAALLEEAGVPAGGLQVVPTTRALASRLVDDARPRVLSFTGSAAVGFALKARAPRMHTVLELGGDAAVVVMRGADLTDAAARIARGAFAYAGQVCISVQRVLVDDTVADAFMSLLVDETRALACGDPRDARTVVGPLIDDGARTRVQSSIDEARASGAQALLSSTTEGTVMTPAIFEGVPDGVKLSREEVFGPVCTVARIASLDDAIARVNASRFGLQCGIFTDSVKDLWRFYEGVQVGGVMHNDVPTFRVDHMPYGGVKDSGEGREGLPFALDDYEELRFLALRP
jgi:acyl-CoA reductase-like NAD-dependent aldehyde dehydrogenase